MAKASCILVGAPVQSGADQAGCVMGPASLRTAGLTKVLSDLGYCIDDIGDVAPITKTQITHPNPVLENLTLTAGWAEALDKAAYDAARSADVAIFLGGDHSLSLGSVPGVARHSKDLGCEQYVLWLDAHPDFHSLASSATGNLHGTPVAYFTAQSGFDEYLPPLVAPVPAGHVCMMGIRSVDATENARLKHQGITVHDMRDIDENGVVKPLRCFLERVAAANGRLHVSLDVDFLDPEIAPGVGTSVPGGATYREAHLIMEMLHDSGLVTSLDLAELNPFLDHRGRTAKLMVDLTASLMGRKVLSRPARNV